MVCCVAETYGMEYLRKHWSGKKASAPTLEKKHDKYFLRFTYTEEVSLNKTPVKEQTICSVDLGINTDAVCTIMRADGTVLGRRFIDHPSEKDRMYRVLGRIRRFQREHGSRQVQGRWAYAKRLNTELGKKIAREIVFYASENRADVIVFEYLEMKGKLSGKKKQKLQMWRKRDIQKRCGQQAIEKEYGFPESVHGIRAGLRLTDLEKLTVIYRITVCVPFRMERDIIVIYLHRTILEQDILSVKF